MPGAAAFAVALAALAAIATAGCGFGSGEASEGEADLTVTRDYGTGAMLEATVEDPTESETVIRFLDREAEIATRFGGGFVHSIEGVAGATEAGRRFDWFFYVNGVESSRGAAEVGVDAGDRIWWDYRDWTDAMRVPAVVGSWPQPFAAAEKPVTVTCEGERRACETVAERLGAEGVATAVTTDAGGAAGSPHFVVGPWPRIADDAAAGLLDDGPGSSGVFALFDGAPHPALLALDERADRVRRLPGAGLVAAVRDGEDPPVWLVTGSDQDAVDAAAELLRDDVLASRYAVATDGGPPIALPVGGG